MSKLVKLLVYAAGVVVVLAVLAIALFILTRDDAPDAVDLETTVALIEAAEAETGADDPTGADDGVNEPSGGAAADDRSGSGTVTSTDQGDPSAAGNDTADASTDSAGAADQAAGATDSVAGVWAVQVADNPGDLQGEPTVSFAGFRVDEVLSNMGDFTAVGRTARVSGSIELSDTALVAATVAVEMGTLRTDNSFRDSRMYGALDTSEHPVATFVLTDPVALPVDLAGGEAFSGTAQGELTIKGVTNPVVFDLEAQLVNDVIVAVGSSEVVFSDYGVTAPTAPIVVSVEDHGIMEFQLIFTR